MELLSDTVISMKNVNKTFKGYMAVNDCSVTLQKGNIYGLLGPNGAGKTTIIKMIAGLIKPTSGEIKVCGHNPWTERSKIISKMGVLIDAKFPGGTGISNLNRLAYLSAVPKERVNEVLEEVDLLDSAKKKINDYSFGMTQRLGLAQAMLHTPSILLLDEPFVGLDPIGIQYFKKKITKLAESGITILLSNHQLEETNGLINDVIVINKGSIVFEGTIAEVEQNEGYIIETTGGVNEDIHTITEKFDLEVSFCGNQAKFIIPKPELNHVLKSLVYKGFNIKNVEMKRSSLKDIFMEKTQEKE